MYVNDGTHAVYDALVSIYVRGAMRSCPFGFQVSPDIEEMLETSRAVGEDASNLCSVASWESNDVLRARPRRCVIGSSGTGGGNLY